MNRRGFIGSIIAASAAPAIVRAESLMKIVAPSIWLPNPAGKVLVGASSVYVDDVAGSVLDQWSPFTQAEMKALDDMIESLQDLQWSIKEREEFIARQSKPLDFNRVRPAIWTPRSYI